MPRVVITGTGVVSPLGSGREEFLRNLAVGVNGIGRIRHFDTSHYPTDFCAEAKKGGVVIPTDSCQDRKAVFFVDAMRELFASTALDERYAPQDRALHVGSGIDYFDLTGFIAGTGGDHAQWEKYRSRACTTVKKIAQEYDIRGGVSVNVSACVASSQAIGLAYRSLKHTGKRAIIAGGFDSMLSPLHYMGFYKLGALSQWQGDAAGACRPFDKGRCGIVIGEGAAVFLFEDAEQAPRDRILAEMAGYASTMDAYMVTDPDPRGESLAAAAREAIREAGITPDEIDCVHLHETGTIKNALAESKAMELVFPDRFREIPVFSLKGQIGHLIGACGAMETLAVLYSLQEQVVPPTINFEEPDPMVPLRVIRGEPLRMPIRYVLKLNAAFGGQNTALVVKRYDA